MTRAQVRKSVLPNGIRVLSEPVPQFTSATLGIWVENGSFYETPRAERHLALPRAHLLQGDRAPHGEGDRRVDRRGRRGTQRVHRQGVHLLLRQGPARGPAARARRAVRPVPAFDVRRGRDRARARRDPVGDLRVRGHAGRPHPRGLRSGLLARPPLSLPITGTAETVAGMRREDFIAASSTSATVRTA